MTKTNRKDMSKLVTERAKVFQKWNEEGVSKAGKAWSKTTIVFAIEENTGSSRFVPVSFFGDEQEDAEALKKGDVVDITYFVSAREWQGRWFTEAKLFSCRFPDDNVNTASRAQAEKIKAESLEPQSEDLPF